LVDRYSEHRRQGKDGASHVRTDDGVPSGHEDFGFTCVDHFGDEF
jgi:hypothetical protein